MKRILIDVPRSVVTSVATLMLVGVAFALLYFTLGSATTAAIELNARLLSNIQQANGQIGQTSADIKYVGENIEQYEMLLNSDRLVPHTRRVAVLELQRLAQQRGLTTLNYKFSAAAAGSPRLAQAQAATDAYRLSVEDIELSVGAPTDGPIYGIIVDMMDAFPGAAVLQSMSLTRAPTITDEALEAVSQGSDSKLVSGLVKMTWRTAQAQEEASSPSQAGGRP